MHQLENLCNLPRLLLYPSHSSFVVDVGRSGKSLGWLGKRPNCYYLIHLHWKVDFLHFGTSSYPCCLRMQSYCSGVVEVLVMSKMKNCLKRLCFQWTLQFKYKVLTWFGTTRVILIYVLIATTLELLDLNSLNPKWSNREKIYWELLH